MHPSYSPSSQDVGARLLWSEGDEEFTEVGVRDGSLMEGIDLWDEAGARPRTLQRAEVGAPATLPAR